MFEWLKGLGSSASLSKLHQHFLEMLDDGRHVFDAAANALVGGTDVEVIREDLYATDQRINLTEQAIRREMLVHGTAHGTGTFSSLLVLMSLVKDAERVGDYAKNIFELAALRPSLGTEQERAKLVVEKDQVSKLLVRARGLFEKQNEAASQQYLKDATEFQKACDAEIARLLTLEGENTAARALARRYFKRVVSHAANVVTSVVMPVDKIDYMPGRPHSEQ